jgi:Lrp/AsnC family transcriptional regulator for asnA, asnC and gidA
MLTSSLSSKICVSVFSFILTLVREPSSYTYLKNNGKISKKYEKYLYKWNKCSITMVCVDEKDQKIIELVKEHGDYTTRQIAKKTLLPITTVHHRLKKLKEEGIIKNYTVNLDYSKLEKNFVVYVLISANLELLKQKKKTQHDLAREIKSFYFVERVDIVSGGTDLVAIIRVKDVDEFDKVLLGRLQLVEGIEKTQSLIVIHPSN